MFAIKAIIVNNCVPLCSHLPSPISLNSQTLFLFHPTISEFTEFMKTFSDTCSSVSSLHHKYTHKHTHYVSVWSVTYVCIMFFLLLLLLLCIDSWIILCLDIEILSQNYIPILRHAMRHWTLIKFPSVDKQQI